MDQRNQILVKELLVNYKNLLAKKPDFKDLPEPADIFFPKLDAYLSFVSSFKGCHFNDINLAQLLSGELLAQARLMRGLGFLGHFGATTDVRQFMLNFPSSKITLLWIPKNSCTSVKRMLLKYESEELRAKIDPNFFHELCQEQFGLSVSEFCKNNTYQKIAIIRHPYERIVSCYLDKFVKPVVENKPFEDFIKGHVRVIHKLIGVAPNNLRRSISFSEFVFYIFSQPCWLYDAHWRPQSNFIYSYEKNCILIANENIKRIDSILGFKTEETTANASYGKKFIEEIGFTGEFADLLPVDIAKVEISNYNQFIPKSLGLILNRLYSKDKELYNLACLNGSDRSFSESNLKNVNSTNKRNWGNLLFFNIK